ncbi:MAG: biotin/lipoyl-containing protein, partial [SAR324 cluster bacterium]|nr:biotin/lipoyl-containing protein [SAR324 cluster bacterium]
MSEIKDVTVPDIGDFDMVEVIEVLVKSGDTIALEDPLITMESDKASMDVPSPFSGTVKELKLKAGDKVSQNDLILTLKIDESEIVSSESLENSISSLSSLGKNAPANTGPLSTVKDESKNLESKPPEIARRTLPTEMHIEQKDFLQAHAGPSVRKF